MEWDTWANFTFPVHLCTHLAYVKMSEFVSVKLATQDSTNAYKHCGIGSGFLSCSFCLSLTLV